jgi:hypothetical protein
VLVVVANVKTRPDSLDGDGSASCLCKAYLRVMGGGGFGELVTGLGALSLHPARQAQAVANVASMPLMVGSIRL